MAFSAAMYFCKDDGGTKIMLNYFRSTAGLFADARKHWM